VSVTDRGLKPHKAGRLKLSSALVFYVVRLRQRWVQELLAVVGIAAGVALLYATQVASTSLSGPVRTISRGLVGHSQLQLMSRGAAGLPDGLYDQVIALPGVLRAAPVLQVPGNLVGPRGERGVTFFGADPRIVRLRGNLLKGFSSQDAAEQETILIPAPTAAAIGIGVGDDVRLQLAGRTITQPAVVAGRAQIGGLVDTSIALAPLAYLQHLTGSGGRVTRILVEARPHQVDAVRRRLGRLAGRGADVRPADYEVTLFDQAAKPTSQASTIFALLSAMVGWLFAVCALLVTAGDRRVLVQWQRELGYSPSATLGTLLIDAAVVGVVGVAVGLAGGELLSRGGFSSDISFLSGAFPIGDQRVVTWQSVAVAAAGGLLAAAVGVLVPVREVLVTNLSRRNRPARGRPAGDPSRRQRLFRSLGVVLLAVAIAITVVDPAAAVIGLVALAIALVLLLPAVLSGVVAGLRWCNRGERSFAEVELAMQQFSAHTSRARMLAIVLTGAVAVFGATSLEGARGNLKAGLDDVVNGLSDASPIWVAPKGAGDVYGTTSFPPSATKALADLRDVGAVAPYRAGLLDIADRRAWIIGAPRDARQPLPPGQILDGDMQAASARIRGGGWATISRALADDLHIEIGQRLTLPTPKPLTVRIAAITTNLGWSAGAVVMSSPDFARAWGSEAIAAYHVRPAGGARLADARQQVVAALGPRSALRVETSAQRADRQLAAGLSGLKRLQQIAQLTLLAAVLAMSAAMTGLLWQHRPLLAELKIHGLRSGFLWRFLLVETGVLFAVGALAGGLFGFLGQVLCTRGVEVVTGFPVVHQLRLETAATIIGVVIASSLLAVLVPGYMATRVRVSYRD
jgi:putative ABC transport system permease protein